MTGLHGWRFTAYVDRQVATVMLLRVAALHTSPPLDPHGRGHPHCMCYEAIVDDSEYLVFMRQCLLCVARIQSGAFSASSPHISATM